MNILIFKLSRILKFLQHPLKYHADTIGSFRRRELIAFQCNLYMCRSSHPRAIEHRTVNRGDGGSIPPTAVSKLRQFRSPHICLCLSEETLKAGGPLYLVSMPGGVKDPTQGVNV